LLLTLVLTRIIININIDTANQSQFKISLPMSMVIKVVLGLSKDQVWEEELEPQTTHRRLLGLCIMVAQRTKLTIPQIITGGKTLKK
jgi:hypothetical protein